MAPEQQQQSPTPLDVETEPPEDLFTDMDIMMERSAAPVDVNAGMTTDDLIAELDSIQAEREAAAAAAAGSDSIAAASEDTAAANSSHGGFPHPVPCRPRNPAKRDSIVAHVFRL